MVALPDPQKLELLLVLGVLRHQLRLLLLHFFLLLLHALQKGDQLLAPRRRRLVGHWGCDHTKR